MFSQNKPEVKFKIAERSNNELTAELKDLFTKIYQAKFQPYNSNALGLKTSKEEYIAGKAQEGLQQWLVPTNNIECLLAYRDKKIVGLALYQTIDTEIYLLELESINDTLSERLAISKSLLDHLSQHNNHVNLIIYSAHDKIEEEKNIASELGFQKIEKLEQLSDDYRIQANQWAGSFTHFIKENPFQNRPSPSI
jgi:hypothetical protein